MSGAATRQVRNHPILSEFCDPLPRLAEDTEDVSRSVSRFGELLGAREKPLSLGLHLTGDVERYLRLRVGPQGADVAEAEKSEQPDLEIIASEQVWRSVAGGTLSPLAAMAAGGLRFRGDVMLARQVVRQVRRAGMALPKEA